MNNQDTQSEFDDLLTRWKTWYEGGIPSPYATVTPGEIMTYRSEAHRWIDELSAYQARHDRAYCMCEALQAAIEEFQWSQKLINRMLAPAQ